MRNEDSLMCAAFSPEGLRVVTASSDAARLWAATTGAALGTQMRHEGMVSSVAFSPDDLRVLITVNSYSSGGPGTARLWGRR